MGTDVRYAVPDDTGEKHLRDHEQGLACREVRSGMT